MTYNFLITIERNGADVKQAMQFRTEDKNINVLELLKENKNFKHIEEIDYIGTYFLSTTTNTVSTKQNWFQKLFNIKN